MGYSKTDKKRRAAAASHHRVPDAGTDRNTVDVLTGHVPKATTDRVYNARPNEAMLRAAVEAVRLPEAVKSPAVEAVKSPLERKGDDPI